MNMSFLSSQDFIMSSAIENHMTNEDLGPEATQQDRIDLDTFRDQLKSWESTIFCLGHPAKERSRWTQVPPQEQDRKKSQPRHRGRGARQGKTKAASFFHPSTRVWMFRPDKRGSEYKRMDKLVKGDKFSTRRNRTDKSSPRQGLFSTVECVMTSACPPEGQALVDVEGNFLTPDHYVTRGNGTWTTAGELTPPGGESSTQLALLVYNIVLQEGEHIELGNRMFAATLGARFDTTSSQKEPTYSEKDAKHLRDLPGYSSGPIHWALGMNPEDLDRLGAHTLEDLIVFVQSHLISHGSRWMHRKAYVAWSRVQESLTMILYDIIKELLRIQSRQDTLHQTEMLQAIADSTGDTSQTADVTIHGFSILPQLKWEHTAPP